jgi:hypothetical protein
LPCNENLEWNSWWDSSSIATIYPLTEMQPLTMIDICNYIPIIFKYCYISLDSLPKCKFVWKQYRNLPHTPVALTRASKYYQMLQDHPAAWQSAFKLCKSSWDLCARLRRSSRAAKTSTQALRVTWWHTRTAVGLRVTQLEGISYIIIVCVTVTSFTTS